MTPSERKARSREGSPRRQQILDAAVSLFAKQGVAGTTTSQIAQAAEVSEGLIFRYFPTKLDLVRAVMGTSHVILGDLRRILEDSTGKSVEDVMGSIAVTWLQLLHREEEITSMMFSEALINPEMGEILHQVIEEGATGIGRFLDGSKKVGKIARSLDTGTLAHMYMSSILIFFIRYRGLSEVEWDKASVKFAEQLKRAWLRMVTP